MISYRVNSFYIVAHNTVFLEDIPIEKRDEEFISKNYINASYINVITN